MRHKSSKDIANAQRSNLNHSLTEKPEHLINKLRLVLTGFSKYVTFRFNTRFFDKHIDNL